MNTRLRRKGFALLTVALLLILASPALAAPHDESAVAPALTPAHALSELLAWLGSWIEPAPVRNLTAPGGHTVDPNGEPAASEPTGEPAFAPEGGGTVDPDG